MNPASFKSFTEVTANPAFVSTLTEQDFVSKNVILVVGSNRSQVQNMALAIIGEQLVNSAYEDEKNAIITEHPEELIPPQKSPDLTVTLPTPLNQHWVVTSPVLVLKDNPETTPTQQLSMLLKSLSMGDFSIYCILSPVASETWPTLAELGLTGPTLLLGLLRKAPNQPLPLAEGALLDQLTKQRMELLTHTSKKIIVDCDKEMVTESLDDVGIRLFS